MNLVPQTTTRSALRLIPADEIPAFTRQLTATAQRDVLLKLEIVDAMLHPPIGTTKGQLIATLGDRHRLSRAQLYRYQKDFKAHGWRGLIDGSRHPSSAGRASGKPAAFRHHVAGLFDPANRDDDGREVHRVLVADWQLWRETGNPAHAIPGYDDPPAPDPQTGIPRGWSYSEILKLRPEPYARELTKRGAGAKNAAALLPNHRSTRVGTRFLQRILFDDQDYDQKVVASGIGTGRPVGFNCLDYTTGAFLDYHLRLLYRDDETGRKKTLTQKEFTWFVLRILQRIGYRTDRPAAGQPASVLVFEHGTADAFRNKKLTTLSGHHTFDEAISAATGGLVSVERSGLYNSPAFAGLMFNPQSAGNPRFKAPLESVFHVVRTYSQRLPGQIGRSRDHKPAESYGLEKYETTLAKAAERIPDHLAQRLIHGMLTFTEWAELYRAIYRALNWRTDHSLEGWEACGFVNPLWRWSAGDEKWFPREELSELKPHLQNHALDLIGRDPEHLTRNDLMAPAEALQHVCKDPAITRLDHHATPLLIPREWAAERTIPRNRELTIGDPILRTTKHHYLTAFRNRHGRRESIDPGTRILAYHNPFEPDALAVCDAVNGNFIGVLERITPARPHDTGATIRQLERRAQVKADLDAEPRMRAATLMDERRLMHDTNEQIMRDAGDPLAADRKAAASRAGRTSAHQRAAAAIDHDTAAAELEALSADPDATTDPSPAGEDPPVDLSELI